MEPSEVTARFSEGGTVIPLQFTWRGSHQQVDSIGRNWTDESGLHILVMVVSRRMYELIFRGGENRWYIQEATPDRSVV